jgi:hypothetical protein
VLALTSGRKKRKNKLQEAWRCGGCWGSVLFLCAKAINRFSHRAWLRMAGSVWKQALAFCSHGCGVLCSHGWLDGLLRMERPLADETRQTPAAPSFVVCIRALLKTLGRKQEKQRQQVMSAPAARAGVWRRAAL